MNFKNSLHVKLICDDISQNSNYLWVGLMIGRGHKEGIWGADDTLIFHLGGAYVGISIM